MSLGLVGRKIGMTRVFTDDGSSLPVTVLEVSNNRVTQVKSAGTDGYTAVQLAHGVRRPGRVSKAAAGHSPRRVWKPGSVLKELPYLLDNWTDCKQVPWSVSRSSRSVSSWM